MIVELLNKGKRNAKTTRELMRACGFTNKRALTLQIEKEREEGAIICSTTAAGGGYYLPQDKEEIRRFVKSMENRAHHTLKIISNAKRLLNETEGQIDMECR